MNREIDMFPIKKSNIFKYNQNYITNDKSTHQNTDQEFQNLT